MPGKAEQNQSQPGRGREKRGGKKKGERRTALKTTYYEDGTERKRRAAQLESRPTNCTGPCARGNRGDSKVT